jgi:hypothetical protein
MSMTKQPEKTKHQRMKQHFYECVMMGYIGTAVGYFAVAVSGGNVLHDSAIFVSNLLLVVFLVMLVSVTVAAMSWVVLEEIPGNNVKKPETQDA